MKKIKYLKTESNIKRNKFYKDEMNQFNYRLFKINEENKKIKLYKSILDDKEIGKNIKIKSSRKNNNIRIFNFLNINNKNRKNSDNFILTTMYTNNSNVLLSNKKNNNKRIIINSFSNNEIKDMNQNTKYNMCLVPLFYHKNKSSKKYIPKLSNDKFFIRQKNRKSIYNEFLDRKIVEKNIIENKRRVETEENDMKPKMRFINLKKELLDENLKINKMFGTFQKQILEEEKNLKSKMIHYKLA